MMRNDQRNGAGVSGFEENLCANSLLSGLLDHTEIGIYVTDWETDQILFANRKAAAYAGLQGEQALLGVPCYSLFGDNPGQRCASCPRGKLLDEHGNPLPPYVWENYFPKDNLWVKCVNRAISWNDGRLAQLIIFYDITETKLLEQRLSGLAYTDQHLGLKNGLMLERDMQTGSQQYSLVLFDIRSLQKINEAYGRDIGDALLCALRDWVLDMKHPEAELYRVDSDAFCLAVPNAELQDLTSAAEAILARFKQPWRFDAGENTLSLFCEITVGVIPGNMIRDDEPLLNLIERTLNLARDKNEMTLYDEKTDLSVKQRLRFELSLKRCVRENMEGFAIYYQPIADPITGTWCGFEALCRWNSPELGPVSPNFFIPEAERLELIDAIGIWALETAVAQCKAWALDRRKRFILDVNLSAIQFSDERLAEKILRVLRENDFPGEKLCLEITESTQFTFTDLSLQTIRTLREKNVLVALDDFGTGYSNFNNLKTLPIDIVKIERVFVTHIDTDSYQQYLFHAMSELAHAADMKLVAEGVENREQVDILLKNGADYLQGYLFSKPLPASEMEAQLHHFHEIDSSFNLIRNRKIDIRELLDVENGYILTPNLYKILNRGMRILFYHSDMDEAIEQVLRIVGLHMDVSRTYVYLHEYDNIYSRTHEWCAEGIASIKEAMTHIEFHEDWLEMLKRNGLVLTSDVTTIPKATQIDGGIKAVAVIPLWEDETLLGFVGFSDCLYNRDWRPEEVLMLHNLCVIITSILSKRQLRTAVSLHDETLRDVLDKIDMPIYVSDVETGKILLANRHITEHLGRDITGGICWEVLRGRTEMCEECKVPHLLEATDQQEIAWTMKQPFTQNPRMMHDSLIRWSDNRMAHLAYITGEF